MTVETIATGTEHLLASLEDGILTLTMNRPEARNALSREMLDALSEQLAVAELNADVRCVVMTGTGKGFCAGGDVKAMNARRLADEPEFTRKQCGTPRKSANRFSNASAYSPAVSQKSSEASTRLAISFSSKRRPA